jgi:glyoxylase-like metal-dependent hydrolase (beta-lactamase superfamily II)
MEYPAMINAVEYPGGVLAIDTGFTRERMACSFLVEAGSEAAFIETGANSGVSRLLGVLERRGWRREQVRYVIVTHVHLDHAGAAGRLMREFPAATLLVHPRGARHMIDPARLEASVRKVYGDEAFDRMYGSLVPVEASRTREMADGETVILGDRELLFRDTPGHARHHFCVWDERTRGWFAGDTFGLSYRELDTAKGPFIFPTTTPIEFDPPALKRSIRMLLERRPQWMYLTHYGRVGDVPRLAADLAAGIDAHAGIAERHAHSPDRARDISREIGAWLKTRIRAHGVTLAEDVLDEVLANDISLNTQGVGVWLDRRERQAGAG